MKTLLDKILEETKQLEKDLGELHKPFAGMIEDKDPYGVIEDEINQDHANDNNI
jgi:hypothetical protein